MVDQDFFLRGETITEFVQSMRPETKGKFEQLLAEVSLSEEQKTRLARLPHGIHVLVIAEDWSGDVLYNLPVLVRMAQEADWDVRVFRRDKYPDLILPYRKEGIYRSIPVFVFYDSDFNEIGHWIERPALATKMIEEESLALRRRLREAHREEWRQETLRELLELLGP
jgi:hypothetical protein